MNQVIGNLRDGKVTVVNNLTSTSVKSPLAANQGRMLDTDKADKVTNPTPGNVAVLGSSGNCVDSGVSLSDKADKVTNPTPGNVAVLGSSGNAVDGGVALADKADKVPNPTAGNVAVLDSSGNAVDGGTNLADLNDGWDGEVNTFADLPAASDNDGKKYVVKTPTVVLGFTTKYAGTYISDGSSWNIFGFKQASVINQLLTGFTTATTAGDVVSTDSILTAFGKLQKNISDIESSSLDGKILIHRYDNTQESYGSDITLEFPSSRLNSGSGISYSNGVFTLSKSCNLSVHCSVSFLNNSRTFGGDKTDDTCAFRIDKSTDGGLTYSEYSKLQINPSNMVDRTTEYAQSVHGAINFSSNDKFIIKITEVADTQFMVNKIVTIQEQ